MFANVLIVFLYNFCHILCDESFIEVNTTSGVVKGHTIQLLNKSIDEFFGIPFAEPPIGRLRFAKPEPIKTPLKGTIDATNGKNSCFQNDKQLQSLLTTSEDCLVLNIWSPQQTEDHSSGALKPVMFWIYGGGFRSGSIYLPTYSGRALATHGVVIVTVNYRVGPFGWLYGANESAPGNVGLYDQLLALQWVKQNIHSFGGDPNMITIFGESAGSWSVSAHILSPLSRGLFKRAILESGAIFDNKNTPILTKESALKQAKQMAKHFNCSEDNDKWLECLRRVDAKELNSYYDIKCYPIEDSHILPTNAQNAFKTKNYSTDIEIIAGVTQNEGSNLAHSAYPEVQDMKTGTDFTELVKRVSIPGLDSKNITEFYLSNINTNSSGALRKAFYDFYGDVHIICPTYLFAKQFAENTPSSDVYFYEWTYATKLLAKSMGCTEEMGVCHASDIEYVFGLPLLWNSEDKEFSDYVMKMWTNFAKKGKPIDNWPTIIGKDENSVYMKEIHPLKPNQLFKDWFKKTCDEFWFKYFV